MAGKMVVTITPGANNPPGTVYIINATGSGTSGTTNTTEYDDAVNPEDASVSSYTAIATHTDWEDSAPSNTASATRGTLGVLSVPTISASYDSVNHRMVVTIQPGANNPADTTYVISATGSGTGGTTTTTQYLDAVHAQDGSLSCYTCVATHANWTSSSSSNQACANRGVVGVLNAPSIVANWDFDNHVMVITITKGANNPSGTTYVITATGSGTGGSTLSTTFVDDVNPEDGSQSCYVCHATATNWTNSANSAQACATRGNAA